MKMRCRRCRWQWGITANSGRTENREKSEKPMIVCACVCVCGEIAHQCNCVYASGWLSLTFGETLFAHLKRLPRIEPLKLQETGSRVSPGVIKHEFINSDAVEDLPAHSHVCEHIHASCDRAAGNRMCEKFMLYDFGRFAPHGSEVFVEL